MTMKKILFSSVCALALCGTSVFAEQASQGSSSSAPSIQAPAQPFSFDWTKLSTNLDTDLGNAKTEYEKFVTTQMTQAVTTTKGDLDNAKKATTLAQENLDKKITEIGKPTDKVNESGEGSLYAKLNKAGTDLVGKAGETAPASVDKATNLSDLLAFYKKDAETNKAKITAVENAIKDINAGKPIDLSGDAFSSATALAGKDAYNTAKETLVTAIAQTKESDKGTSNTLADKLAAAQKAITDKLAEIKKAEEDLAAAENKTAESKKATAEYKALVEKQALFNEAVKAQTTINNGTTAATEALAKAKADLGEKDAKADNGANASAYAKYNYAKEEISKAQKTLGTANDKASDTEGATLYAKLNKAGADLVGKATTENAPTAVAQAKNLTDLLNIYKTGSTKDDAKATAVENAIKDINAGKPINLSGDAFSNATALAGKDAYNTAKGDIETAEKKLGTDKADGSGATLFDELAKANNALQQAQENVNTKTEDLTKAQKAVADAKATLEKAVLYTDEGIKAVADVKASLGEYASMAGGKANVLAAKFALVGSDISKADKEQQKEIQTIANEIAQSIIDNKKDAITAEALSTLNVQINNMNKRMGELRGLDGNAGAWVRTWGGRMSGDGIDSFNYYSTQIGADKKSSLKNGDLYLGVLAGFDKVNSDIKSTSYSGGIYASYLANNGFFFDSVAKFVKTSHDKSGYDIDSQTSFLASFEGGYRVSVDDAFYVEPSVEFITGRVGEFSSKQTGSKTTISVDAFSPVVFKPQVFVGGNVDNFTYRAGVGGVLTPKAQEANVLIEDIVAGVNANANTKLDKNNHGFVSLGTSYKATDNLRLNLGLERSFGGKLKNDYELNTTIRYSF